MKNWYKDMLAQQRRIFWVCFGGWALDAFDVQMLGLAIPSLLLTWHLTKTQAGLASTFSLVASALGGWLAGALTDRYGRVRLLQLTIVCFSVFSFLSAFSQNLPQLIFFKTMQGFGFGGEWAVGSVLLAEVISARARGRAMAVVQSGWAVGWGAAVLCYAVLASRLPGTSSWRVMFALGLLPALLVLFIQRSIQDPFTPHENAKLSARFTWLKPFEIFDRSLLRLTLLATLLGVGAHGGYYAISTWLPTYLRADRKLSVLGTSGYLAVIIMAFWLGCMASSLLLDRIGRRLTILGFAIGCVLTVVVYLFLPISNSQMLALGFPLGFFSAGIPSSMGALLSELFPHGVRGTGVGFCYNFGRIVAAMLPTVVGRYSATIGLRLAIGVCAATAYSIVVLATFMLPETRGRELA